MTAKQRRAARAIGVIFGWAGLAMIFLAIWSIPRTTLSLVLTAVVCLCMSAGIYGHLDRASSNGRH